MSLLLLDTAAVIRGVPDGMPAPVRSAMAAADAVLLSVIAPWEIAIKRSAGKLELPRDTVGNILDAGVVLLPVELAHAVRVEHLPRHHGDPFDRLLIAQAQVEGATIVTPDRAIAQYDVPVVWS